MKFDFENTKNNLNNKILLKEVVKRDYIKNIIKNVNRILLNGNELISSLSHQSKIVSTAISSVMERELIRYFNECLNIECFGDNGDCNKPDAFFPIYNSFLEIKVTTDNPLGGRQKEGQKDGLYMFLYRLKDDNFLENVCVVVLDIEREDWTVSNSFAPKIKKETIFKKLQNKKALILFGSIEKEENKKVKICKEKIIL